MRGSTLYRIVVKQSVLKDIRRIPTVVLRRVRESIARLAQEPVPPQAQPLSGYAGIYRIRVGSYRILYEVAHEIRIITVVRIGHRRDVYRK